MTVSIAIETTGVSAEHDAIIEIGAVRIDTNDELSLYVNPGRPIPPAISRLTGIRDRHVRDAPDIEAAAAELRRFMRPGEAIIGHNAPFDLRFLAAAGVRFTGPIVDVLRLSRVVLPDIEQRELQALARALGLPLPKRLRRALDDARLTARVFRALRERA